MIIKLKSPILQPHKCNSNPGVIFHICVKSLIVKCVCEVFYLTYSQKSKCEVVFEIRCNIQTSELRCKSLLLLRLFETNDTLHLFWRYVSCLLPMLLALFKMYVWFNGPYCVYCFTCLTNHSMAVCAFAFLFIKAPENRKQQLSGWENTCSVHHACIRVKE